MYRSLVEIGATVGVSIVIAAAALVAGGSMKAPLPPIPSYVGQPPGCLDAPVVALDGSGVVGRAKLCIVDEAVRPAADVEGLNPGTAYAAWLAYFDRPQECQKLRCTVEDLRGENAVGVAGRMDGMVADGTRKAQLHGDFRDLRVAGGAEVSLFVFERGPVSVGQTRARARQLLTLPLPGPNMLNLGTTAEGGRLVAQAVFSFP